MERNVVADLNPRRLAAWPRPWGAKALAQVSFVLLVLGLAGCRQDMHDQAKYKPYRQSAFFRDGRTSRPLPPDTVARGQLREDELRYTGMAEGKLTQELPAPVTASTLRRGQERYDIYCSPCHDRTGSGNGMIVQRGYRRPPSFHDERLRQLPVGYFYDVIRNGFGVMPNYAQQIDVDDRWAIVAYIRALQLSQNARLEDVPPAHRSELDAGTAGKAAKAEPGGHHE